MNGKISVYAEGKDGRFWTYVRRSAGELPATPLHGVMEWILEQLNFGNFETERDSRGDVVSVTIGRAVPRRLSLPMKRSRKLRVVF